MLGKATHIQTRFLLRQKGAMFTFCLLLALVLLNYTQNIFDFQGRDVLNMYHPLKLLALSYNRVNYNADITLLLVQLYPLLVNIPAGLSLAKEKQTGEDTIIASRLGTKVYLWSKLLAVIVVSTIVFSLPFLLEILLNCIAFPLSATGDLTNWNVYAPERIEFFNRYFFRNLYLFSPYLYAVFCTLLFGLVTGVLAGFTTAISAAIQVKYRILLLLPVFLLLHGIDFLSEYLQEHFGTASFNWYNYLLFFNDEPKIVPIGPCVLGLMLMGTLICIYYSGRKDCLK